MADWNPTSAPGPEKFHTTFLKKSRQPFNKDTLSGILHHPRHPKPGQHGATSQGRHTRQLPPEALTPNLIKSFEVMKKHLINHLELNHHFNRGQHGLRGEKSTLTQLLAHREHIIKGLGKGLNINVVFLNFAEAFDNVDYSVVLSKLRKILVVETEPMDPCFPHRVASGRSCR